MTKKNSTIASTIPAAQISSLLSFIALSTFFLFLVAAAHWQQQHIDPYFLSCLSAARFLPVLSIKGLSGYHSSKSREESGEGPSWPGIPRLRPFRFSHRSTVHIQRRKRNPTARAASSSPNIQSTLLICQPPTF